MVETRAAFAKMASYNMADEAPQTRGTSLLDLPDDLFLSSILPSLSRSTPTLLSLRATHPRLQSLIDTDLLWKQKLSDEFNMPLAASATTARSAGSKSWRKLYFGIVNAKGYVWGESGNCRLALDAMQYMHPKVVRMLKDPTYSYERGVPFPFLLDLTKQGVVHVKSAPWRPDGYQLSEAQIEAEEQRTDVGAPVSIHASG